MNKAILRFILIALFPLLLNASHSILKNDILKQEVSQRIETMGKELVDKTGFHAYVIATNEHFPVGFNLVEYTKKYESKLDKPYVIFVFAPFAKITQKTQSTGRVGIIPSSKTFAKHYDYEGVRDAGLDVISVKDKNTIEDKHNIGVLQAFSELADNLASSKNVELESTLPNDTGNMVFVLKILIYFGSLLVLWIFILRPLIMRIKNGNK
jgi:hypothetical protein